MTLLANDWENVTENPIVQGLELISGNIGVLLLHEAAISTNLAFTWAHTLHEAGMSVCLPVLEKNPVTWQETGADDLQKWLAISEQSLAFLKNRCSAVFLIGISMASTIVLRLAELLGCAVPLVGNWVDGFVVNGAPLVPGQVVSEQNAHCRQASARRELRAYRAWTIVDLPEARVTGDVDA